MKLAHFFLLTVLVAGVSCNNWGKLAKKVAIVVGTIGAVEGAEAVVDAAKKPDEPKIIMVKPEKPADREIEGTVSSTTIIVERSALGGVGGILIFIIRKMLMKFVKANSVQQRSV